MSTSTTLNPNTTVSHSGDTLVGAASNEAALSDSSDASYVQLASGGGSLSEGVQDFTIASGDQVYSVEPIVRWGLATVGAHESVEFRLNDGVNLYTINSTGDAPYGTYVRSIRLYGPADGSAFTQTQLNAMRIGCTTDLPAHGGTPSAVRIYKEQLNIVVLSIPGLTFISPIGTHPSTDNVVTWGFLPDLDGLVQTSYRVKIFYQSDAVAGGFDPETSPLAVRDSGEVISSDSSYTLPVSLPDGAYHLYVKAAQGRKHYSLWVNAPLTVENGPDIPVLSPNSGDVIDTNAGFTASWTYHHRSGVGMARWAFRRATDGGAYEYWDEGGSSWSGAEVQNTGATLSKAFAAATWPDGHTYAWSVRVQDTLNAWSPYASDHIITASAPPSANVTAPSGSITTTTRPTITWSYSDASLRAQDAYQAKVFLHSVVVGSGFDPETSASLYDSGIVAGVGVSDGPGIDFPIGATSMDVYVKVLAGGQWSAWDSSNFSISVTPPTAPSLTAVEDTSTNAVTLTATGVSEAGFVSITHRHERNMNDGNGWLPVRFGTALVPNGSFITTVKDQEVIAQTSVSFRVKALGVLSGGGIVASAWSTTTTCTLHPKDWWIKDVTSAVFSGSNVDSGTFKPKKALKAGSFFPIGRTEGVVVSEPAFRGMQSPLGLWIKNGTQLTAAKNVLNPGKTLLIQDVLANQWYVRISGDLEQEILVAVHVSLPRENAYRYEMPVTEVARPSVS